jgi:hypothetical protein
MTQRFAVAMRSLIWRVTVSVPPPGVKGTTMRIDLAGHSPGWLQHCLRQASWPSACMLPSPGGSSGVGKKGCAAWFFS